MTDIQTAFAKNVRKYRKAARLSQEKLAELAGVHRTYIGGIEQRRVNVSLKNIGKIASALEVDPALLFLSDDGISQSKRAPSTPESKAPGSRGNERPAIARQAGAEYALVSWGDGPAVIRPLQVDYEDLTVHVLTHLIDAGFRNEELVERYNETYTQIMKFLGI